MGTTHSKRRARAIQEGYRSGLEEDVSVTLTGLGVNFEYETVKIEWLDVRKRKYTPDFILLDNGIIIETKGRFVAADRRKHLEIQKQHPDLDIRFVFSNSRARLYKGAKSTYGDWCTKNGFLYSDVSIPEDWLKEKPQKKRQGALNDLLQQTKTKV
jgi:hypothetical protein